MDANNESKQTLIFTYGTLKQGFANHYLLQDLINQNAAVYLGPYVTHQPYPLICGPYNIPYLINLSGSGKRVKGELYSVSTQGLAWLDELEGTSRGHYDRLPVQVQSQDGSVSVKADAYFANGSFGGRLWVKRGEVGLTEYSERDGREYVKIEDRVKDSSVLHEIELLCSS